MMTDRETLEAYSRAEIDSIEVRRRLGNATFGEVLLRLREEGLPLPRASQAGREAQIAQARAWMFPESERD